MLLCFMNHEKNLQKRFTRVLRNAVGKLTIIWKHTSTLEWILTIHSYGEPFGLTT